MLETELKFQVPAGARHAVDAAVGIGTSRRTRLQAIYFDTPDRRLAAAGMALRLRKAGRRWVQTLKAAGPNAMQRLEHNVPLVGTMSIPAGTVPAADPLRHAGTPAGDLLAAALAAREGDHAPPCLVALYRTDIWRRARTLRATGCTVELAFDCGEIVAGERRWPVCELEIELVRGRPAAMIEVGRRWVRRHGLWLDVRSKAERGDRLARNARVGPAVKAGTVQLEREMSADAALHAIVAHCLRQILPNASEIADGCSSDEHVHQLRVGLRRLRSALRFFAGWTTPVDPAWAERLAAMFRQLGVARDRDALAASLLPALRKAGAPLFELPPAPQGPTPAEWLRMTETTLLLLELLAYQVCGPAAPPPVALPAAALANDAEPEPPPPLAVAVAARLQRWHRRVARAARRYAALEDSERHALRKRVKRLRYAAEFVAALYRGKALTRYLKMLVPVQDCLGRYNDRCVGLETYQNVVGDDPRAWFAIGWLTARRDVLLAECVVALKDFARCMPFWKDR
ncbi:MAG: CYTH and CHAD domain-containing protein [Verrucomicrobia bacterium]|nr:CYTH and CHAD domain-containing protein [Verrucomicrobiota bacterium]